MSEAFDPYYSWLGIPPAEQPADYYRLLGISRFESNSEVIANAAEQRMRHVRTFQLGENAGHSQMLLNELATARACLLNSASKDAYEQQLRDQITEDNLPPVTSPFPAQIIEQNPPPVASPFPATTSTAQRSRRQQPKSPRVEVVKIVAGGIAGLALGVLLLWYGFGVDVLDVMKSRDERLAKQVMQDDTDVRRMPPRKEETQQDGTRELTQPASDAHLEQPANPASKEKQDSVLPIPAQKESNKIDESATASLPEALRTDSPASPATPIAGVPSSAEQASVEQQHVEQAKTSRRENSASSEGTPDADIDKAPVRLAVPPPDALATAEASVRSIFADEYASTKTPAEKVNLASKLLQVGSDTHDDMASRFVTIRSARNVAVESGNIDLALRAFDSLSKSFDLDVLAEHVRLLVDLSKVSLSDGEATKLRSQIIELRGRAFSDDRYPLAMTLNQTAKQLGKATDKEWQEYNEEWASLLDTGASAFEIFKEANKTLKESPDDPDANLAVGRYRCLLKGEWRDGLPYLEKGNDKILREFAKKELTPTVTPTDTLDLADSWWNFARDGDLSDFEKRHVRSRTAFLYQQVLSQLSGLSKVRAEKRLEELESLGVGVLEEIKSMAEYGGMQVHAPLASLARKVPEIGLSLSGRKEVGKAALLAAYGGTDETENAVEMALEWLIRNQQRDGTWSLAGPYADGVSGTENPMAATAMALLALQGAGNTHRDGKFVSNVKKGMDALLKMQDRNGCFFTKQRVQSSHQLYSQAQATIAICELYGMTGDSSLRDPAQRSLDYAGSIQADDGRGGGGWRYMPGKDVDTSVTGWFVVALRTGEMGGLSVSNAVKDRISRYLDNSAAVPKGEEFVFGSRYLYRIGERDPRSAMTAEALLCRQYLGWEHNDPRLLAGVRYVGEHPIGGKSNVYYWYYATQLMYQMGGKDWDNWNRVMRDVLPTSQVKTGRERGSWSPASDLFGYTGGRLFMTCLSTYMLEVYYRHTPIYRH